MSLEDIRSECSETAALLQPYVDGELETPDAERVSEHVTACRACRAAVAEQHWVRATLRALEREQAPTALRGSILAALDEVELEHSDVSSVGSAVAPLVVSRPRAARPRASMWSSAWSTLADISRGAMVMVPAGAVAVGLFFVARDGMMPVSGVPGELGAALMTTEQSLAPSTTTTDRTRPGESLPPATTIGRGQLQLVGAQVSDDASRASAHAKLRYEILRDGLRTGRHVVDHQSPLGGPAPAGHPVDFRGRRFVIETTPIGEPAIYFESAGLSHSFVLEGGDHDDDIPVLLELAEQQLFAPGVTP
ncbi:MAG: zf-HC2 domain-containing protein [Deltaproteobacteria bacterium]|nr:zf-HC2 domain-containing protein [Nannocystaceae bacterium]